jgi:hypothetical protein
LVAFLGPVARVTPPCGSPEALPPDDELADDPPEDAEEDADDDEPAEEPDPADEPDDADDVDPDVEPDAVDADADPDPDETELEPLDGDEDEPELPAPELEHADTARATTLSAMAPVMALRNISDLSVVIGTGQCRWILHGRGHPGAARFGAAGGRRAVCGRASAPQVVRVESATLVMCKAAADSRRGSFGRRRVRRGPAVGTAVAGRRFTRSL